MRTGFIHREITRHHPAPTARGFDRVPARTRDVFISRRQAERRSALRCSASEPPPDPAPPNPAGNRPRYLGVLEALFTDARYLPGQLEAAKTEAGGLIARNIGQFSMAYPLIRLAFISFFPSVRIPYLETIFESVGAVGMYGAGVLVAFVGNLLYVNPTLKTKEKVKIRGKGRIAKHPFYKAFFNVLRTHGNFLRSFVFAPASAAAGLALITAGGWLNVYVGIMACLYVLHLVFTGHVAYKWGMNSMFPRKDDTVRLALNDMDTSKHNLVRAAMFVFKEIAIASYMFVTLATLLRFSDLGKWIAVRMIYSPNDQMISAFWLLMPFAYQLILKNFFFKPLERLGVALISPFTRYAENRIRERMQARGAATGPQPGDPKRGELREDENE